jgi:hypothetical protein
VLRREEQLGLTPMMVKLPTVQHKYSKESKLERVRAAISSGGSDSTSLDDFVKRSTSKTALRYFKYAERGGRVRRARPSTLPKFS